MHDAWFVCVHLLEVAGCVMCAVLMFRFSACLVISFYLLLDVLIEHSHL